MKWNLCRATLLMLLAFCLTAGGQNVGMARAASPKTVLDYFRLLPSKYTGGIDSRKLYPSVDIENDYVEAGTDSSQVVVALFRHSGRVLVAVTVSYTTGDQDAWMLRYSPATRRWSDVTRAIVPRYSRRLFYVLPRHGTTIIVREQSEDDPQGGRRLYRLTWRNGAFHVED